MRRNNETFRRIGRALCGLILVFMAGGAFAAGSPQQGQYEIRLLGKSWTPAAGVTKGADRALAAQAQAALRSGQTRIHALVQLRGIPEESQRNDLWRAGLDLGSYVPGNAWIATIPVDRAAAVTRRPEVRWIEPWTAGHKLHPRLAAGKIASWARDPEQPGWIVVMVLLHKDVDLSRGVALAERAGGLAGSAVEGLHGMLMRLPVVRLTDLAAEEEVLWIEPGPPPLSAANDGIRSQMKVDTVNASPYDLDGEGVRLLIFDEGTVRASHETFDSGTGSRVTLLDSFATSRHATSVAATAAGDGSGSAGLRGRGVAPAAEILSATAWSSFLLPFWMGPDGLEGTYAAARNGHEADLANNSVGFDLVDSAAECALEGDYATTSTLIDQIVRGDDAAVDGPMIAVWSAGNERGGIFHGRCGGNYGTTAEPACAKNPIQVGAINSDGASMTRFSSWGPCDDGRLKPTVVAPGCETGRVTNESFVYTATCGASYNEEGALCVQDHLYQADSCGTSMAAPAVSGAVSLLLQDWRQHLSTRGATARLLPALVKAALIHTSRDLGADGPDYRYGYGAVDAQALIDLERAAGTGGLGGPGLKAWGTDSVSAGQTDSFTLTLPGGVGELKASLAWDDAAAMPFTAVTLVNDLDLELVAPDGTVYRPFVLDPDNPSLPATAGADHLNNQEQVLVKNPPAGVWTVRVAGTSVPQGPQSYGLVYSAAPRAVSSSCTEVFTNFEAGYDSWTMTGSAVRAAPPTPGHGGSAAQLGGVNNDVAEVKRQFDLPVHQRSILSFDLNLMTAENPHSSGYDDFTAEVRKVNGDVLAVVSFHNDGDIPWVWLTERNIDLSPWAGQTVVLVFRLATSPQNPTTVWVDHIRVASCPAVSSAYSWTISSTGTQDGHVFESSETSNAGGAAAAYNSSSLGPATFQVGDNAFDQQIKGFVSFDTSGLPDDAVLVSARLVLYRSALLGTNPFTTHGVCRVEIKTGAFNNNLALEPADFQAAATGPVVSILSNPTVNGSYAYATLSPQGLAAVDRTGTTQLRLSFAMDDNDDLSGDALFFLAGEDSSASLRPRLEVKYLLP